MCRRLSLGWAPAPRLNEVPGLNEVSGSARSSRPGSVPSVGGFSPSHEPSSPDGAPSLPGPWRKPGISGSAGRSRAGSPKIDGNAVLASTRQHARFRPVCAQKAFRPPASTHARPGAPRRVRAHRLLQFLPADGASCARRFRTQCFPVSPPGSPARQRPRLHSKPPALEP